LPFPDRLYRASAPLHHALSDDRHVVLRVNLVQHAPVAIPNGNGHIQPPPRNVPHQPIGLMGSLDDDDDDDDWGSNIDAALPAQTAHAHRGMAHTPADIVR
jgi:hypothetical protein